MNLKKELSLIISHINNQQYNKAIKECEKIINSKVQNTEIYNFYGLAFQKKGLINQSIEAFNKSIQLNKNNFLAMNNLAISYKAIYKMKLSDEIYKKCLNLKPDYIIAIINYANLKQEINEFKDAISLYLKALDFKTGFNKVFIFSKLSNLYQTIGDTKKAKEYAEKIIKQEPNNVSAHELISRFINYEEDKNHLSQMEELIKKNLNENEIIDLTFCLGRVYESIKNYKKAFEYFERGNKLRKNELNYNSKNYLKLQNNIIHFFGKFNFDKITTKKTNNKKIIFICGMPRSGTTLVEQIISSHNKVTATGENIFLSSLIKKEYLDQFILKDKKILKDSFSENNNLYNNFFDLLNEYNFKKNIFTDKTVQNFLWVGFIKIFFPNAKIIITDRNSKDICSSIFKINFKNGFMNFAYNQKDIAEFYNIYSELTTFWKKLFKDEIYTVSYEQLIKKPNFEIKKLINYCDLEWDPSCLKHYTNKSPIRTASINQARKPIYKSSINLSKNYSIFLEKMFKKLN